MERQEVAAAAAHEEVERLQHLEDPAYKNAVQRLTESVRQETAARLKLVAA